MNPPTSLPAPTLATEPPLAPATPLRSPASLRPRAVPVVGMPLAVADYDRVCDWMDATIAAGERSIVTAAAVHLVMVARENPEIRSAICRADVLAVPDGQPLVWALKALGHPDATRCYGPDLMARHLERSVTSGARHYLYGGRDQGALVQLALELRRRFPGVRIVGGYSPPFRPLTEAEEAWVIDDIHRSGADIVWVGTGQPKQERWMAEMRGRLQTPILAGVGAAFDFHAGLVPQAPSWMQRNGLEWAFRLAQEPRRLWRRYARYNPRFVAAVARQLARERR
jgi:N-acetylglucosaminyldiphosphoundecaprenol N-acetyl-beta-D-mannosaminyltransferase